MADQSPTDSVRDRAEVRRNEAASTFELVVDGDVKGRADYREYRSADGEDQRIFFHTEVDESLAGTGLGSVLARTAMDSTREAGLAVVPVCPFIRGWLEKHPDHPVTRVEPTGEHLQALRG